MLDRGTRLGGYVVRGPLGAGGMGEVYRAHDERLDRDVAIKVLPGGMAADPERLARFQQEARAASALNHPNILHIYDVGQDGGTVYLVMELVEGRTLRALIQDGAVPLRKLLEIGEQAAAGLAKAHAAGIVHRDLKPENLMLTEDGVVKILDFGLAKLLPKADDSGSQLPTAAGPATGSGMVLGTAAYMSPEQARGQAVAFPSDQFSLGTVLYELACGERPFRGDSFVQTLSAIIESEPEPLSRRDPRTPAPLQWILARCLAKEPSERYASTLDLARDLRSLRENLTELSSARLTPAASPRRRRRGVVLGAVAGALLGAVAMFLLADGLRTPPEPAELRAITFSGADGQPDASPDGRTLAFVSLRDGRSRIWLKQLTDGSEVPLTAGNDSRPRFSPDGTSVLFARTELDGSALHRIPTVGGEPRLLVPDAVDGDWSPDGRQLAFVRYAQKDGVTMAYVALADLDGGGETQLAQVPNRALAGPRFSPDGEWISVSGTLFGISESTGRQQLLVRADGSEQRWLDPPLDGGDISAVAWLPSGREVVYTRGESATTVALGTTLVSTGASRIFRQDIFTGRSRVLLWTPSLSRAIDFLGPAELVFDAVTARQHLQEFVLAAGPDASPRALSAGASLDRQPVYSPDGSRVLFSSNRSGNLDIWELDRSDGTSRRLTDHRADDWDPVLTPDGTKLIFTSRRSGNFEIWMANADGSGARQVTRDGVDAENATATPDGRWLVYNSGNPETTGVWKIRADGTDATRLVAGTAQWPEVSPDGRFAAYSTVGGKGLTILRVVRIEDGELLPFEIVVAGGEGANGRCRWLPDGSGIAFTWHRNDGPPGIYAQDFDPAGGDTSATRRALVVFGPDVLAESFGLSADGTRITVAGSVRSWTLMQAARVPGL